MRSYNEATCGAVYDAKGPLPGSRCSAPRTGASDLESGGGFLLHPIEPRLTGTNLVILVLNVGQQQKQHSADLRIRPLPTPVQTVQSQVPALAQKLQLGKALRYVRQVLGLSQSARVAGV